MSLIRDGKFFEITENKTFVIEKKRKRRRRINVDLQYKIAHQNDTLTEKITIMGDIEVDFWSRVLFVSNCDLEMFFSYFLFFLFLINMMLMN